MKKIYTLILCATIGFTASAQTQRHAAQNTDVAKTLNVSGTNKTEVVGCDTLSNITNLDTLTYYRVSATAANWGFLTGMNYYFDKAKADKFLTASYTAGNTLRGAYFYFGKHVAAGANSTVDVNAWDASGTAGAPGAIALATSTISVSAIPANGVTFVPFTAPVVVTGDFFVGIQFGLNAGGTAYLAADTITLVSNTIYASNPLNSAWEMWSNGTWYAFVDPADYGISLSQFISPVLCAATVGITSNSDVEDITLAPNPSNGLVSVFVGLNTASSVSVRIMNSLGQVVKTDKMNAGFGGKVDFDFSNYSNGVYFVEVRTGASVTTKRLVINK